VNTLAIINVFLGAELWPSTELDIFVKNAKTELKGVNPAGDI